MNESNLYGGPAVPLASKSLATAPSLRLIENKRVITYRQHGSAIHPNSAVSLRFIGCSGIASRYSFLFNHTLVRSFGFRINKIEAATIPNRSVSVIAAPYRENLLAEEDGLVVGGTARPGSRRGTPSWCHSFCQRDNFVIE